MKDVQTLTFSAEALLSAQASPETSCEVRHPGMPSAAVIGELVATRWRYSVGLEQGFALFHTSTAAVEKNTRGYDASFICGL